MSEERKSDVAAVRKSAMAVKRKSDAAERKQDTSPQKTDKDASGPEAKKSEQTTRSISKSRIFRQRDASGNLIRQYLGWEDAKTVEDQVEKEETARRNWRERWGCACNESNGCYECQPWMKQYNKWVCSDIRRAMRKPSYRSLEWLAYFQKGETPVKGECCTRRRTHIKDYFVDPITNYCCTPCSPWPITTAAEVGWLANSDSCKLEIYGNKYMQMPPLPGNQRKISSINVNI